MINTPHHHRKPFTEETAKSNSSGRIGASANPHEDHIQISDLAERRRIQNRLAQRNYRKY